jgi:hypothetical protein
MAWAYARICPMWPRPCTLVDRPIQAEGRICVRPASTQHLSQALEPVLGTLFLKWSSKIFAPAVDVHGLRSHAGMAAALSALLPACTSDTSWTLPCGMLACDDDDRGIHSLVHPPLCHS